MPKITEEMREHAEQQISSLQKKNDFDIREYPLSVICEKTTQEIEDGSGLTEFFIPDYQRDLVWTKAQQCRFIESLLLNLPVPYIYVSDVQDGDNEGLLEIVDGSQRIRTIVNFLENKLILKKLKLLTSLDGFKFSDLSTVRQMRFKRKTLRVIELIAMDEESRRELFDRLNTGGSHLTDIEKRFGSRDGGFLQLVKELAADVKFRELCPVSQARAKRKEYEELVLRFFAYSNNSEGFSHSVNFFLNDYLDARNKEASRGNIDCDFYRKQFHEVMNFVDANFDNGFKKHPTNYSVPRIRFESIAVGSRLALNEQPDLVPVDVSWVDGNRFSALTKSDASNSKTKLRARLNFAKNSLLGLDPEEIDKRVHDILIRDQEAVEREEEEEFELEQHVAE